MAKKMLGQLQPDEASRRFNEDPSTVYMFLPDVINFLGLSEQQALVELRSGRLKTSGIPDGNGGFRDVAVRGDDLLAWLTNYQPTQ